MRAPLHRTYKITKDAAAYASEVQICTALVPTPVHARIKGCFTFVRTEVRNIRTEIYEEKTIRFTILSFHARVHRLLRYVCKFSYIDTRSSFRWKRLLKNCSNKNFSPLRTRYFPGGTEENRTFERSITRTHSLPTLLETFRAGQCSLYRGETVFGYP